MLKKNCSVVILAAGRSSRMGKPKFLLELPNGISFLQNITHQYSKFGILNIVVVLNSDGIEQIKSQSQKLPAQTQFVLNDHPEYGRFYSIKTGLQLVNNSYTFIHNIDNPFAEQKVLEEIYSSRAEAEVVKPVVGDKGGHPVLVSKQVIDKIVKKKDHDINFKEFLAGFPIKRIVVKDDSILLNLNSHNEYLEFYRR